MLLAARRLPPTLQRVARRDFWGLFPRHAAGYAESSKKAPSDAPEEVKPHDLMYRTGLSRKPYHLRRAMRLPRDRWGGEILVDPLYNKGTAVPEGERDRLGLRGLLPPTVLTLQTQLKKLMRRIRSEPSDIRKNLVLRELHDRNETLFHRVLVEHIEELAPVIYTPTVGRVCQDFDAQFTRPRGMYFTARDKDQMQAMVNNWPQKDVQVVVITDGSRILGLGDLGANGMGIPIGKLALYVAAGGIAPHRVMPALLDVGTNNPKLLEDEFYLGLHHERIGGEAYFELMDEFMHAVYGRYPKVLVQFEDFSSDIALQLLSRYRNDFLCFNDDIQGTGVTTLAGMMTALRQQNKPLTSITDQKFVVVGAGSAGIGVSEAIAKGMALASDGAMSLSEARSRFYVCDKDGLIARTGAVEADLAALSSSQQLYLDPACDLRRRTSILDTIRAVAPTVLLGVSGVGGLFSQDILAAMGQAHDRPIIFPLSNPTDNAECTAEEVYGATNGRAIFASGSPFAPVVLHGVEHATSQANNMFAFPGIGLGAVLAESKTVSDAMLHKAAVACAKTVTDQEFARGQVFPAVARIREVSERVAAAVLRQSVDEGLSRKYSALSDEEAMSIIMEKMYYPAYVSLISTSHEHGG